MQKILHLAAVLVLSLAVPTLGVEPVAEIGAFTFSVTADGSVLQVPYDANTSLSISSAQIQRAVVLVPGSSRSSSYAYDTLLEAAATAGVNAGTTLFVAPQFLIEADIDSLGLPANWLFWSEGGWKEGSQSLTTLVNPRPARLSSFAVMDSILHRIASRNPNLISVVVAGHSAGGQFVQRFAAGSLVEQTLQSEFGVDIAYVVANPSSYLYFDPQRVVAGTQDQFAVPSASVVQSCPGFDDYKYGLQARNTYMSRLSKTQIRNQFAASQVSLLLGELDVDPNALDLDIGCAAMLQGANRFERGTIYGNYILHFFGPAVALTHRTIPIPGVGHDSRDMFTSACGAALLFGHGEGSCVPVDAGGDVDLTGSASLLTLQQCRPNPFRGQTTILYGLSGGGELAALCVYDVHGRLVRTLYEGRAPAGLALAVWDGRSDRGQPVPAGVYFYRLQQGNSKRTQTLTLLR